MIQAKRIFFCDDFFLIAFFAILPLLALPVFYDHYALTKAAFVYALAPAWILMAIAFWKTNSKSLILPKFPRVFLLFLSLVLSIFFINLALSSSPIRDTPLIIRGAFLCLIFSFYLGLSSKRFDLLVVAQITLVAALAVSVLGIFQVFGFFPLSFVNPGNGGPHATFGNVNMTAEFIVLGLFCLWYIMLRGKPQKILAPTSYAFAGIIFSSYLLLLACRSVWLIVALSLIFLLLRSPSITLKYILWPVIVGIGLGLFIKNAKFTIPETPLYPSISAVSAMEQKPYLNNPRYEVWRDGLAMIKDHPWLGVGPENYEFPAISYRTGLRARVDESSIYNHPHNEWLKFAIEDGLPFSLILGLLMTYLIWRRLAFDIKNKNESEIFITVAFIIFYLVQGTFQFPFADAVPYTFLALFLARCLMVFPEIRLNTRSHTQSATLKYALMALCSGLLMLNFRFLKSHYLITQQPEDVTAMETACHITSSNWRACMGFAHILIRQGEYQKSFPILEEMLAKQPNNFLALKMYALAKIASGDSLNGCLSLRIFDFLLKGKHSQKELLDGFCQKIPPLVLGGKHNVLSQYHLFGIGIRSS